MNKSTENIIFPKIDKIFKNILPKNYLNRCLGWSFSPEEISDAASKSQLLTLDIETIGKSECSLHCAHCFRKTKKKSRMLSIVEFEKVIHEAKALGLRSVKIIGKGEPLEDPKLFSILEILRNNKIQICIFTKGHVLACEELSKKIFGMKPEKVLYRLYNHNISLLFGINSFNKEVQDKIVGLSGFSDMRNRAIELSAKVGFNSFTPNVPTRLALVITPMTHYNYKEIFIAYKWANLRNMHVVTAPTMVAGLAKKQLFSLKLPVNILINTYFKVISWGIKNGALSLEELKKYGCSAYAGGAPCNQISAGMYVQNDGQVLRCPGDDVTILGNLKKKRLKEIWHDSENYKLYRGKYNNGCPPKTGPIFGCNFFEELLNKVLASFEG